jgi:hypothetical protein
MPIDAQRQREQAWLRIDPISGLPNMRALGERLQHFWRDNDGIGKACLIVAEMGNLRDLRLRYGPLQDNGLWQRDTPAEVHRLLPSLPVDDVEVYQFGDAALAILVRGMTLSELRIQAADHRAGQQPGRPGRPRLAGLPATVPLCGGRTETPDRCRRRTSSVPRDHRGTERDRIRRRVLR